MAPKEISGEPPGRRGPGSPKRIMSWLASRSRCNTIRYASSQFGGLSPKMLFEQTSVEQKITFGLRFGAPTAFVTNCSDSAYKEEASAYFDVSSRQMISERHETPASSGARTRTGFRNAQTATGKTRRARGKYRLSMSQVRGCAFEFRGRALIYADDSPQRRVCAQYGRDVMGWRFPVGVSGLIRHIGRMIPTCRRQGQAREGLSGG